MTDTNTVTAGDRMPVIRVFSPQDPDTDASIQQAIADQVRAAVLEDVGLDSRMAALNRLVRAC